MTDTWLLIGAVLAAGLVCLCSVEPLGRRYGLSGEVKRKALHLVTGALALSFPWLFDAFWPVAVICGAIMAILAVVRLWRPLRGSVGRSLHDVDRSSWGEFLFPLSVAVLFLLSEENRLLYLIPVLALTTADSAAALVAPRYGLTRYRTMEGGKSWEGTVIFVALAFLSSVVPLLVLSDIGRLELLLISCLVAVVGAMIEAASWSGLDNLFVPFGTYFLLDRVLALPATSLFVELFIVLVLAAVTAYWSRRTRLTAQANFAAVLVAFGYWTLGGMPWLIPSFAIYIMHPLLVRLPEALRRSIGPRAILGVATASLPWFLLYKAGLMAFEAAFYPYCVALAGHLTMISVIRRRVLGPGGAHWLELGRWSMLSTLVYMVVFMAVAGTGRETQLALVLCWPIVLLTGHGFDRLMPKGGTTRRWVIEAASAIVAASIGWLGYATLSGQL